jgi:hypothetical protein
MIARTAACNSAATLNASALNKNLHASGSGWSEVAYFRLRRLTAKQA